MFKEEIQQRLDKEFNYGMFHDFMGINTNICAHVIPKEHYLVDGNADAIVKKIRLFIDNSLSECQDPKPQYRVKIVDAFVRDLNEAELDKMVGVLSAGGRMDRDLLTEGHINKTFAMVECIYIWQFKMS